MSTIAKILGNLIAETVIRIFPQEGRSRMRGYIRQKLNNADKTQKRKGPSSSSVASSVGEISTNDGFDELPLPQLPAVDVDEVHADIDTSG